MNQLSNRKMSRRQLLIASAGAAGVVSAGAALPGVKGAAAPPQTETKAAPERGGGYRVSEHVLHYYRTARV